MDTERLSPRYANIDLWDPADVLDAMIEGQLAAVAAVRAARRAIERAALDMEAWLRNNGRLIYAGAGTSGRLAVQDGVELIPTFNWPRERLLILLAGGEKAMSHAVEGAEDEVVRAAELTRHHTINATDVLVAVAASGTTPFTLACLREGRRAGALTIGIANNSGTPILTEADHPILLETGPEPIAGSTRMNAGTAQRITLSVLSSLVMIRLGRVYRGMMVDMRATNAKLANRQVKMLMRLTGRSEEESREALRRSNRDVKIAVMLLEGCEVEDAKHLLEACGGRLQAAIDFFARHGSAKPVAS